MTRYTVKRIGVLTGGGASPGINAVISAITKTAINQYNIEVIGFIDGFKGLVENKHTSLSLDKVSGIMHTGGTILGTTNRDNPFRYLIKSNGEIRYSDQSPQVEENLKRLGLDGLLIIGGDGSLNIAYKLFSLGLNIIGIPKTIDNDIYGTDVSFGFNTAVDTASQALDRLHTTAESHHRVMIMEVMGRNAGWIALYAGISGGADIILIPEMPYDIDSVLNKIMQRRKHGKKFSVVVIAEGAKPGGGEQIIKKTIAESHERFRLGGIGQKLGDDIENRTDIETRVTVLGHLQRGGSPVPFDRILALRYGVAAVDALMQSSWGCMVSLQGEEITTVPLKTVVSQQKQVDPSGSIVRAAKEIGINFGD